MDIQVKTITTNPNTSDLLVVVTMPTPAINDGDETPNDHTILIPPAALTNRMAFYGLASRDEALLAILKEHAQRLNAMPAQEKDDPKTTTMGGLRDDVAIDQTKATVTAEAQTVIGG